MSNDRMTDVLPAGEEKLQQDHRLMDGWKALSEREREISSMIEIGLYRERNAALRR